MQILKLRNFLNILVERGLGNNEIETSNDVLYFLHNCDISEIDKTGFENVLKFFGCVWDEEEGCFKKEI
jgi:hypothetical protein